MLTEEAAAQCWCPFARITSAEGEAASNRFYVSVTKTTEDAKHAPCIGRACMAWRWRGWVNLKEDGSLEQDEVTGTAFFMTHPTKSAHGCVHLGYCGLVGDHE